MEVRELGPGDEGVLDRAVRAFRDAAPAAPDLFLADPRAHVLVALDGEEIVGWCHGYEVFRPEGRWQIVLLGIDVAEHARREGIGRILLERFADLARSKGHGRVWLLADAGADAARRLFPGSAVRPSGAIGYWWVFG